MNRSHRLLGQVHRLRKERLSVAENRAFYEPFVEVGAFADLVRDLHGDGYIDRELTYDGTVLIVDAVVAQVVADRRPGGVVDQVGRLLAPAVFAARLRLDGLCRRDGAGRYIAYGCGELAEAAVFDRVYPALGEVIRRRALIEPRAAPCWPTTCARRFAEAVDAGRSFDVDRVSTPWTWHHSQRSI